MKKLIALLLCLAVVGVFVACAGEKAPEVTVPSTTGTAPTEDTTQESTVQTTEETVQETTVPEETEPVLEATSLYGIDVSGMTRQEAKDAITQALEAYNLRFTANGQTFVFSASELSVQFSEENFNTWFDKTSQGEQTSTEGMLSYNLEPVMNMVKDRFAKAPVNATASYDSDAKAFVVVEHTDGVSADVDEARAAIRNAVATLSPSASAAVKTEEDLATITGDDPKVKAAADNANSYLDIKLTYVFKHESIPTTESTITAAQIASFLTVDKDLNVKVDGSAVDKYIEKVSYENGGTERRSFISSHGTQVGLEVDYYVAVLDRDGMREDIIHCVENKISGKREAPFLSDETVNLAYGGTYVEIDLNNQYLWFYRNGSVLVQTPLVSGSVATGAWTPPGVFSLVYKASNTYLVGAGYRSYVNYWMPFNGGIGMHDATWRSEFGGNIYMYSGSHGCINLPLAAAGTIYSNITPGTKIIVYGGAQKVGELQQEFVGTDSYTLQVDSAPFALDVTAKYTGPDLTYSSSDPNVVTVDSLGNVTVVGAGEAVITVSSADLGYLKAATFEVKITVEAGTDVTDPTEPETDPTDPTPPETEPETEPTEPTPPETDPTDPTPPETEPETESEPENV